MLLVMAEERYHMMQRMVNLIHSTIEVLGAAKVAVDANTVESFFKELEGMSENDDNELEVDMGIEAVDMDLGRLVGTVV
jgi:hypothetical protein